MLFLYEIFIDTTTPNFPAEFDFLVCLCVLEKKLTFKMHVIQNNKINTWKGQGGRKTWI